jgi:hypothetical protein
MTGTTMNPIFGIFFAFAGLALAAMLGLVLYKDKKPEEASSGEPFKIPKKGEAA